MDKKKLLITGCGRSGTLYSAEVWRSLGLDIQHERDLRPEDSIGQDGITSWFLAADHTTPPFGPSDRDLDFEMVLHQVRHPLKVIPSFAQYILQKGAFSKDFIEEYAPETQLLPGELEMNPKDQYLLQAAKYWLHWNRKAELKADKTIQLENLNENLPELCRDLQIDFNPEAVESVAKDTNSRAQIFTDAPWTLDWEELKNLDENLYENIVLLAEKYGYSI